MSEHEHDPWASLADTLGVTPGGDAPPSRPVAPPQRPASKARPPQNRPAAAAPAAEDWDQIASELGVSGSPEEAPPRRPPVPPRSEQRSVAPPESRQERFERRRDDEMPAAGESRRRDDDRPRAADDDFGAGQQEPRHGDRDQEGARGEDRGPGRRRRRGRRGGRGRGGQRDLERSGDAGRESSDREPSAGSADRAPRLSDDRDRDDDRQRGGQRRPLGDDRPAYDDDDFGTRVSRDSATDGGTSGEQPREGGSAERDEDRPRRRRRRGRRGGRGRSRTSEDGVLADRGRDEAPAAGARPQGAGEDGDDEPLPTGYGGRPAARATDAPRSDREGDGEPRGRRRRRGRGEGRSRGGRESGSREGRSSREGGGRQRRSGESRSSSFSRGRRDDFVPVAGGRDEDDEGLEFLGVEEAGQDAPRRPRHPEDEEILAESGLNTVLDVPSWVEAIGIVIAGNLDARGRSHRGGDDSRSSGRRGPAT